MELAPGNDWLRLSAGRTLRRPGRVARWIGARLGRTGEQRPFDPRTEDYFFRERGRATDAWDYYERFIPATRSAPLRVLDLACGAGGRTSAYAWRTKATFVCVDMDLRVLQATANRNEDGRSAPLRFLQADGMRLPFRGDTFDVCLCENAMEHLVRPDRIIAELTRVLKPGGQLFTMFPPWRGPFSGHLRYFTGLPWVHLLPSHAVIGILLAIDASRKSVIDATRWRDDAALLLGNVSGHLNGWSLRDLLRAFQGCVELRFVAGYVLGEWGVGRLLRLVPWCGELFSNSIYLVFEKSKGVRDTGGDAVHGYNGLLWQMARACCRRQ